MFGLLRPQNKENVSLTKQVQENALLTKSVFTFGPYEICFKKNGDNYFEPAIRGFARCDVIALHNPDTLEEIRLEFHPEKRKLLGYTKENVSEHGYKNMCTACSKTFVAPDGDHTAEFAQRLERRNNQQAPYHVIRLDAAGNVAEERYNGGQFPLSEYCAFVDEQELMPLIKSALLKEDDTTLAENLRAHKAIMLDYLTANIALPQSKIPFAPTMITG